MRSRLMALVESYVGKELLSNLEFQSGLLRLALWSFMVTLLGVAGWTGYYELNWEYYGWLFGTHLVWYGWLLTSVIQRPEPSQSRRFLGMAADLSGVTFVIFLRGDVLSPFFLFYFVIFVSQGTRYGKTALTVASVSSFLAYSILATVMGGWAQYPLEIAFLLLILTMLPLYQHSLLRQLHRARGAAEEANAAKGKFLATITHELRTPLSGVIGMSSLLGSTRLDNEQRDYVDSLSASANMLQALIGDILDLSKIDARKLELKPASFDIRRSVTEVAVALSNQALDKGVEMLVDVAGDVPSQVYGDPLRFRQVLFNLVGNAVKFTEQGRVMVEVRVGEPAADMRKPHLNIAVRDTGVGIAADALPRVFDSFWQADDSSTRSRGGTGLGTAISRELVQLMHGDIGVESTVGSGTVFRMRLPFLTGPMPAVQPPVPAIGLSGRNVLLLDTCPESLAILELACSDAGMRHVSVGSLDKLSRAVSEHAGNLDLAVLMDNPHGLDLEGLSAMVESLCGHPLPTVCGHYARRPMNLRATNAVSLVKPCSATMVWDAMLRATADRPRLGGEVPTLLNVVAEGQGARVLVAEDDSINAKLIESLLRKGGHQPVLVRDGKRALEEALASDFDLALVDLRMPEMDGVGFARSYREQKPEGRLPIVALTANAAEDARDECLAAGMDEFLTKPVDPQRLDQLLRQYQRMTAV